MGNFTLIPVFILIEYTYAKFPLMSYISQMENEKRRKENDQRQQRHLTEVRQHQKTCGKTIELIKTKDKSQSRNSFDEFRNLQSKLKSYFFALETWYHILIFTCCLIVISYGFDENYMSSIQPVFTMILLVDIAYRVQIINDIWRAFSSKVTELLSLVSLLSNNQFWLTFISVFIFGVMASLIISTLFRPNSCTYLYECFLQLLSRGFTDKLYYAVDPDTLPVTGETSYPFAIFNITFFVIVNCFF